MTDLIRQFTAKGWIIRPISPDDDIDDLARADLEAHLDELAHQEACRLFGGIPIEQDNTPAQLALF